MAKDLIKNHPSSHRLHIYAKSAGKTEDLAALVPDFIKEVGVQNTQGLHVYFLSGLCDITCMEVDREYSAYESYEEVVFMEPWQETVDRVTKSINSAAESMFQINVTPIFCTIPPMSFHTWNHHRLQKGNTSFLLHHNHYEDMQYSLITAIQRINNNIVQINSSNGVTTPHLATTVMTNMGPNRRPRVFYNRFRDGVHAAKDLKKKWAKKLCKAMYENRNLVPTTPFEFMDSDAEERDYIDSMVSSHLVNVFEEARSAILF